MYVRPVYPQSSPILADKETYVNGGDGWICRGEGGDPRSQPVSL